MAIKHKTLQEELNITESEKDLLIILTSLNTLDSLLCKWILRITGKCAYPRNEYANELFFIYLVDLLANMPLTQKNLLDNLSSLESIIPINNYGLIKKIKTFNKYLNKKYKLKIYLAEFNLKLKINISIYEMIYFIGNSTKHHPLRLQKTFDKIHKNNPKLSKHLIFLCMESFTQYMKHIWLPTQFPIIVEHLVGIYNSLYSSLLDEFRKYYVKDKGLKYHYIQPEYIKTKSEFSLFWDIMNKVRDFKPINLQLDDIIRKLRPY